MAPCREKPSGSPPAETINVRTQEAIQVLAVCLYQQTMYGPKKLYKCLQFVCIAPCGTVRLRHVARSRPTAHMAPTPRARDKAGAGFARAGYFSSPDAALAPSRLGNEPDGRRRRHAGAAGAAGDFAEAEAASAIGEACWRGPSTAPYHPLPPFSQPTPA